MIDLSEEIKRINRELSLVLAQELEIRLANQLHAWGTLDYAKEIVELKQKLNSQLEYIHSLEAQLAKIDANNRPG